MNWHWNKVYLLLPPQGPLTTHKTGKRAWRMGYHCFLHQNAFLPQNEEITNTIYKPHISEILLNSKKPVKMSENKHSLLLFPSKSHANTCNCNVDSLQKSSSNISGNRVTVLPPYPWGYVPNLQGMLETVDNTKPYTYYIFPVHTYI